MGGLGGLAFGRSSGSIFPTRQKLVAAG